MNYARYTHLNIKPIFNHPELNREDLLWEMLKQHLPKYFKHVYLPTSGNLWFLLNFIKHKNFIENSITISDFSPEIYTTFKKIKTTNFETLKDNIKAILNHYKPYANRNSEDKLFKLLKNDPEYFVSWFIAISQISHSKTITFCWHRPTMLHISVPTNKKTKPLKSNPNKNLNLIDENNLFLFYKILTKINCVKVSENILGFYKGDFVFYDLTCTTDIKNISILRWYYKAFQFTDRITHDIYSLNKNKVKVLLLTTESTPQVILDSLKELKFNKITLESSIDFFITKRQVGNRIEKFQIWKNY